MHGRVLKDRFARERMQPKQRGVNISVVHPCGTHEVRSAPRAVGILHRRDPAACTDRGVEEFRSSRDLVHRQHPTHHLSGVEDDARSAFTDTASLPTSIGLLDRDQPFRSLYGRFARILPSQQVSRCDQSRDRVARCLRVGCTPSVDEVIAAHALVRAFLLST